MKKVTEWLLVILSPQKFREPWGNPVQQGHLGREQGVVTSGKLLPRSRVRRLGSTEIEYKRSLIQLSDPQIHL